MYRGVWGVKDVKENSGTKNNITEKWKAYENINQQ